MVGFALLFFLFKVNQSGEQENAMTQLKNEVQQEIVLTLSDTITLCGTLSNPYGYIRAADLLLIPSYSEAAPLVIGEAAFLGTPILSKETTSAREMIEKTGWGWVCENSEAAMTEALAHILGNPDMLSQTKTLLSQNSADNLVALEMFHKLM